MLRRARRSRLLSRPFPASWLPIVAKKLPFAAAFDDAARGRFLDHLKVFAWEKRFEGGPDLELTEEMRVVVSGCAARLSMNLSFDVFDDLGSVVLVRGDLQHADFDPRSSEQGARVLGLTHAFGTVVLSWDAVKEGLADADDGHDTALHELAHILDAADGGFDGTPPIDTPREVRAFAHAFSRAFVTMQKHPEASVLRAYAATNEAEFFAVATEVFFEQPRKLKKRLPDVYAALVKVYRVDPAGP